MADSAITSADRSPDQRRVAAAVADRLVSADGPLGDRANVLNDSRIAAFDGTRLERAIPATSEFEVRVTVGGTAIATTGDPSGGTTIRRLVLVERARQERLESDGSTVTIPRRADSARLRIQPPDDTTVWTVRANDRVVLHDESGLEGSFQVELLPSATTQLRFQTVGSRSDGMVSITYGAPQTTKQTLVVTVDG